MGRGTLLYKLDIRRAYRILPVCERDRHLLGIKFKNEFYVDCTLPMGGRSCARIFNGFGDVVCYAFERACSASTIEHYLDDFLGMVARSRKREADADFETVLATARSLGIPLAEKKLCPPDTSTVFLGFVVDTISMTVSVPEEKRLRYRKNVTEVINHRKATQAALISVNGQLQHVSEVLKPGRPFIRRLIDRAYSVRELHHYADIGLGDLQDLHWWSRGLSDWVGTRLLTFGEWRCLANCFGQSDASGSTPYLFVLNL